MSIISKFPFANRKPIYGVKFDEVSNINSTMEYTDDAVGLTSIDICEEFNIKPCVFYNGEVQYYLNPNNFAQKEDGTAANITTNGYDVMIEIPKLAYMIYKENNTVFVKITADENAKDIDSRFCYYAHTRDTEGDRDNIYIGAYLGILSGMGESSNLYSKSGEYPNGTGNSFTSYKRAAAHRGTGYGILSFNQLNLIHCLYLLKYKSISLDNIGFDNSQSFTCGSANTVGMDSNSESSYCKFAGIEFLSGYYGTYLNNIELDSNFQWVNPFGTQASQFSNGGEGYISKCEASNAFGFLPHTLNGSSSTYYKSFTAISDNMEVVYGNARDRGGLFSFDFGHGNGVTGRQYVTRLQYV